MKSSARAAAVCLALGAALTPGAASERGERIDKVLEEIARERAAAEPIHERFKALRRRYGSPDAELIEERAVLRAELAAKTDRLRELRGEYRTLFNPLQLGTALMHLGSKKPDLKAEDAAVEDIIRFKKAFKAERVIAHGMQDFLEEEERAFTKLLAAHRRRRTRRLWFALGAMLTALLLSVSLAALVLRRVRRVRRRRFRRRPGVIYLPQGK